MYHDLLDDDLLDECEVHETAVVNNEAQQATQAASAPAFASQIAVYASSNSNSATASKKVSIDNSAQSERSRNRDGNKTLAAGYRLCFAGRELYAFPGECLSIAADVTDLDLSGNLISSFTHELDPFHNLAQLDLSSNQLTKLGDSLASLTHLRILLCKNNMLEVGGIPKSLSTMRSLEVVNLSGNRLAEIPASLLELPSLKQLYLGGNQIERVSPSICQAQSLEVLYLGGNRLEFVPDEISELRRLESLNLSDNRLAGVPSTFSQLHRLKSLYLHGNVLRTLPVEIVRLKRLSELSLRGNPLVVQFVADLGYEAPSLLELAGRAIRTARIDYSRMPSLLVAYLDSARECVNPRCRGVYFTSRVEHVKFVDFCGKFRVPLLQYLCSPHCDQPRPRCTDINPGELSDGASSGSPSSYEDDGTRSNEASYLTRMMKKVLLG